MQSIHRLKEHHCQFCHSSLCHSFTSCCCEETATRWSTLDSDWFAAFQQATSSAEHSLACIKPLGINSHGSAGNSHSFPLRWFPIHSIPIPNSVFYSHSHGIPMGFPVPLGIPFPCTSLQQTIQFLTRDAMQKPGLYCPFV